MARPAHSLSGPSQYTSTWTPGISESCFRKIRSLRVEIMMRPHRQPFVIQPSDTAGANNPGWLEQLIYPTCDCLHMAIKPLENLAQRIYSLEIFIEIENMYKVGTEALAATKVL